MQHDQFKCTQGDKLAIKAPGVDSLEDVHQHLSATEKGDAGGTWHLALGTWHFGTWHLALWHLALWHFGEALSITLTGAQSTELTAAMVVFQ